jgi:ankyrin repeat protein
MSLPTRTLSVRPDLAQLKRQARELLKAFAAGDAAAVAEINTHYRAANARSFALSDAQLVIARAYGFESWPKLRAFVDRVTVRQLVQAVRAGDEAAVRAMIAKRPEIVNLDVGENDEHQALHHAVLARQPAMVRLLMQSGADPRKGIYPHRTATDALTLAAERGYSDIVAIIREEEGGRLSTPVATIDDDTAAALAAAFQVNDEPAIIAALEAQPNPIAAADTNGHTALHWAAACGLEQVMTWLLDHGANVNARTIKGRTPLDVVAQHVDGSPADASRLRSRLGDLLIERGAVHTARWAVASGDADWLRARHAEGKLTDDMHLVRYAVSVGREDILRLLLELGLDPDEAGPLGGIDEVVPTWGEPLRECAIAGDVALAEVLLRHGANPNTNVYAASSALWEAHARRHHGLVALLEQHGARLAPVFVAGLGTEHARRLLAEKPAAAPDLLWGAMGDESPDTVKLALAHIDWTPEDPRWFRHLENAMYSPVRPENFRLVLERSHPDINGAWQATLLHQIAAARGRMDAAERLTLATLVLDAGARLDVRDALLSSTPLGWACRWGRVELVRLFLDRGADPVERYAETWATPRAWAEKMGHSDVLAMLAQQSADPETGPDAV